MIMSDARCIEKALYNILGNGLYNNLRHLGISISLQKVVQAWQESF